MAALRLLHVAYWEGAQNHVWTDVKKSLRGLVTSEGTLLFQNEILRELAPENRTASNDNSPFPDFVPATF